MVSTILGRKIGMTQIFNEDDNVVPVTVSRPSPGRLAGQDRCHRRLRGCSAWLWRHQAKKCQQADGGSFAKPASSRSATCARFASRTREDHKVGDVGTVAAFADVKKVDVTGTSKGKGFAGVIKRYGFAGGPVAHGAHFHRAPGSVGKCATPSRVLQGPAHARPHGLRHGYREEPDRRAR